MSMEAQNLRFVRCPKCLQLLVEYPSIPVYKCGGCDTVLRAKNRGAPVTKSDSGSGEQNNSPHSLEESTQTSKSISSDEQKVVSACTQPGENVVEGNISFSETKEGNTSSVSKDAISCDNINPERTLSVGKSATSGEVGREENSSLVDASAQNAEFMIKEADGKGPAAESSLELIENVQKVEVSERGYSMDDASVGSEVAAVHSMASQELADSGNKMGREIESMAEQKSASNKDMNCHEVAEVNKLYEQDEAKSDNMLSQREDRPQPYEVLIESYEDLIEELERSLSLSDDEDDFLDVADNNGLNDALHNQIGSRRFSSAGKMKDDSRSDPHGRLIEELERSFSDAEEPLEHDVRVADKEIQERVHGREHDKDPQFLVNEAANSCEGSMSSADGEHIQSEQNELTPDGTEEKEDGWTGDEKTDHAHGNEHAVLTNRDIPDFIHEDENEHENKINYINGNEHVVLTNRDISDKIHEDENEHDNKINYVNGNEHIVLISKGIPDIIHENEHDNKIDYVHGNENVVLTNEDIPDIIHENEHDKQQLYLDTESAKPCERSVSSFDGGHLISGQNFQQSELTTVEPEEKDNRWIEDDSKTNYFHASDHVVVTNKDTAERVHENEQIHRLDTESANPCEGAISSFNGHLKSEQSFEQHQLTSDGTVEKEDHTEDDNMPLRVQADNPVDVAGFSSLSNERINCKSPSFIKKKEEISCRYRASLLRQGLSLDSKEFNSIQKFIETQMDGTSSSLSSGSPSQGDLVLKTSNKFKAVDQLERFKKMDGLRDQLNRLSSQKGLERRYQTKDLEYQPQQLTTYDSEQQFHSVDADSVPSSCALDSYYGNGKPPRYLPSNPFSPRYPPPNPFSPAHSYAHRHFEHAHVPHNFDAWEFNSYYQSSQAGSSIFDHDSLKSSFKENKRVVRKHILRPLSGASPYAVCNSCFNLVQIPSDIYMSKGNVGKMQCGKCSGVIVLSVPAVNHAGANISKVLTQKSSKVDNRIVARTESASYSINVNEEYGASFPRSSSTRAGRALAATESSKKVSDSALHLLMGYDSASQLLRHSRAFERHSRVCEDGYESFESMVPVSNRVSRRKNM